MSRIPSFAALLAAGLAAGACAPTTNGLTAASNPSLYSVHQPVVQRTDYVLDIGTGPGGVPPSELQRLNAWFASIDLRYGDRIFVDEPQGYSTPGVRRDVAEVAGRYGLLLSEAAPITSGAVQPGSVRVIASRSTASVPGCPNWTGTGIAATTTTSSNFGCAINSNIAAMVANPNDLVLGQTGSGSGNAATATRAIKTYRDTPPTATKGLLETRTSEGGK